MPRKRTLIRSMIAATLASATAGCQTYRPAPLDLRAHDAAWAARDPASAEVRQYVQQLAAAQPSAVPGTFDPADGLSLPEARVVALFFNPQLRAARLKARVPAVGAAEAGRWEDPVLQVDAERIVQSVEHPWVIGGLLNVTLPLSGRLPLEKNKALAEADAARANVLIEEQAVSAELDAAWTDLAALDQRIALTRTYLTDLDAIVARADKLRAAGELGPLEAGLFRVERVRRGVELRALEPRRQEQELAIKALLGLKPDASVALEPTLRSPTAIPTTAADQVKAVETNHPKLLLARAEYVAAERALELEVRKQFPDLTLGGGYGKDEGTNRILGGLSIPIPVLNANRRAIAEAAANRDAAKASAEATYETLVSSLARASASLQAATARRERLEAELVPLVDQQLKAAKELGRLGDANTAVVFEALTRAHETRLEVLEAAAAEAGAWNKLNALVRPTTGVEPGAEVKR